VMSQILAPTIEVIADALGQPIQKLQLPGLRIDP
jgi:hypothetical protein